MRALLTIFFLILYSYNLYAEWDHMYQDKKLDNWYVNLSKIIRVNDHVFYKTLVDHNEKKKFQSTISENQGDCNTLEWKMTHISFFSKGMAKGYLTTSRTEHSFTKIEIDSILGYVLNKVCKYSLKK